MSSPVEYTKREVVDAVRAQRAATVKLVRQLTDQQWETVVLPGWRVREVIAHLVSTDQGALTGKMFFAMGFKPGPTGGTSAAEAWNEKAVRDWADRPIADLIGGLERWGGRIAKLSQFAPAVLAGRALPTPFGRVSLLWIGMQRVFDEWVHGEDIRRGLGIPSDVSPAELRPVVCQLMAALPFQTLTRIPPGSTGEVILSFRGMGLPACRIDLAVPTMGFGGNEGGSRVSADAAPLVMAAAGRDEWRDLETRGTLGIEGERGPAEVFLDTLRVV